MSDGNAPSSDGFMHSSDTLIPFVYNELRRLAKSRLKNEFSSGSIAATGLVHEAFLRLSQNKDCQWNSRGHFFAAAAEAMRRILIEKARARLSLKRGGGVAIETLDEAQIAGSEKDELLLRLNDALEELESIDTRKANLVRMRYFVGMTNEEIADALQIHVATVARDWAYARAWLKREMET